MPRQYLFQLYSCCGCLSLRTGTLIIGLATQVMTLLETFYFVSMLFHMDSIAEHCHYLMELKKVSFKNTGEFPKLNKLNVVTSNVQVSSGDPFPHVSTDFRDHCRKKFVILAWIHIAICVIYFLTTSVMLYGVKTKRYRLMKPWLLWVGMQIVFFIMFMFSSWSGERINSMFSNAVLIYFALVVNSHYNELQDQAAAVPSVMAEGGLEDMVVRIPSPHKANLADCYGSAPPPYPGTCRSSTPPPSYNDTIGASAVGAVATTSSNVNMMNETDNTQAASQNEVYTSVNESRPTLSSPEVQPTLQGAEAISTQPSRFENQPSQGAVPKFVKNIHSADNRSQNNAPNVELRDNVEINESQPLVSKNDQ